MRTRWEYLAKGLQYPFSQVSFGRSNPKTILTVNPLSGIAETNRGIAVTLRSRSVAKVSGHGGVAVCNGESSASWAEGCNSIAVNRSHFGFASAGIRGVAYAGYFGAAKAGDGGVIILKATIEGYQKLIVGQIGQNGLKPNIWYRLDRNGKFVEAPENKK